MCETLYALEKKSQSSSQPASSSQPVLPLEEGTQQFRFGGYILELGLRLGCITGDTTYDFDHHTSELKFPLGNAVIGGNLGLGYRNLSLNTEVWAPFTNHVHDPMTDKDWVSDILISHTDSKADMEAIIWDANLRYDFLNTVLSHDIEGLVLKKSDLIKMGILLGYKYERFDFDMSDLYYVVDLLGGRQGQTLYQGDTVLTYKIKYHLPYLGVATDVLRKNCGLSISMKYSFNPTAKDMDSHLLRSLTFYGDYDHGAALMGGIHGFWNLTENWEFRLGSDVTIISIDGVTWDESGDPSWNKDQSTDSMQWLFWSGIKYKF